MKPAVDLAVNKHGHIFYKSMVPYNNPDHKSFIEKYGISHLNKPSLAL